MRARLLTLLFSAVVMLLVPVIYAQDQWWRRPDASVRMARQVEGEKTRSAQLPAAIPRRADESGQIDWSQLGAMIAIFGAVGGGVQWLIAKAILEPAINRKGEEIKQWAAEEYPSAEKFDAHVKVAERFHEHVHMEIKDLWRHVKP